MTDAVRITMSRMGRSRIGAARLGITYREYARHIDGGWRWCCACKTWHPVEEMSYRSSKREGVDNICRRVAAERARVAIARRRAAKQPPITNLQSRTVEATSR